jgi:hypothetical protein
MCNRRRQDNRRLATCRLSALSSLDLQILTSDTIDILQHFLPSETETKAFASYLADGKFLNQLSDEDQFLYGVRISFFVLLDIPMDYP